MSDGPDPGRTRTARSPHLIVAATLFVASLAVFWPGIAEYDTVRQYEQLLTGQVDDWHPPVMVRLWQVLLPLGGGTAPLLMLQLAGYWLGFALLAAALAETGRPRAGWAMLGIALLPPFLGWQAAVLKDAQMVGAALAATGLVAWWRLRTRALPRGAIVAVAVLFGYALLVRANAVFALAPLIAAMLPLRRLRHTACATIGIVAAVLALSGPINHDLLGAARSDVAQTQPLFDLAGIAARASSSNVAGLQGDRLRTAHCVTPFFWDPLGDTPACVAAVARLKAQPAGDLYRQLAFAAAEHPRAYLLQRAAHLNMTWRWLVPADLPGAAPPSGGEPNGDGFTNPGAVATGWAWLGGVTVLTPLGWPFAWLALALLLLAAAWRRPPTPARRLAMALLASAITLEASFAAISIASDLRYHLWPMIATALAAVLLADTPPSRRWTIIAAAVALPLAGGALLARAALPPSPQDYETLLHWTPAVALLPR